MRTRLHLFLSRLISTALLFAILYFAASAQAAPSSPSWRYRITVSVVTPEGVKQGSVVRQIGNDPSQSASGGEAVVVDLGKRGYLFGVLRSVYGSLEDASYIPHKVFPQGALTPVGTVAYLDQTQFPKFVYFTDLADQKTVRNVLDEARVCCKLGTDHTEEIFGSGVHIQSVSLQVTTDPVTVQIDRLLPWLRNVGGHNLAGGDVCFFKKELYYCLGSSDFKREHL